MSLETTFVVVSPESSATLKESVFAVSLSVILMMPDGKSTTDEVRYCANPPYKAIPRLLPEEPGAGGGEVSPDKLILPTVAPLNNVSTTFTKLEASRISSLFLFAKPPIRVMVRVGEFATGVFNRPSRPLIYFTPGTSAPVPSRKSLFKLLFRATAATMSKLGSALFCAIANVTGTLLPSTKLLVPMVRALATSVWAKLPMKFTPNRNVDSLVRFLTETLPAPTEGSA